MNICLQNLAFGSMSREDQIKLWYDLRNNYNIRFDGKSKILPECPFCKNIYERRSKKTIGKGAKFYKDKDGFFIGECGGGQTEGSPCDGMKISPASYLDSSTIKKELQSAKHELLRELKHIRDRVFATEYLTKEDDSDFNELSKEYMAIRKIEEKHQDIVKIQTYIGNSYSFEEPTGYEGESNIFKTSKIKTIGGGKRPKLINFEIRDMVSIKIDKEELPVEL